LKGEQWLILDPLTPIVLTSVPGGDQLTSLVQKNCQFSGPLMMDAAVRAISRRT